MLRFCLKKHMSHRIKRMYTRGGLKDKQRKELESSQWTILPLKSFEISSGGHQMVWACTNHKGLHDSTEPSSLFFLQNAHPQNLLSRISKSAAASPLCLFESPKTNIQTPPITHPIWLSEKAWMARTKESFCAGVIGSAMLHTTTCKLLRLESSLLGVLLVPIM